MATPYAEFADLEARFPRDFTSEEEDRAETLLEDASFWLGVWVPGLDAAISSGDAQAVTAAKLLVVTLVIRALMVSATGADPGVASETVGPFSVTYRNPEGNLYLYDRELSDIVDLLRSNRAAAVSMRSPGL
jgi:hypothetical protein